LTNAEEQVDSLFLEQREEQFLRAFGLEKGIQLPLFLNLIRVSEPLNVRKIHELLAASDLVVANFGQVLASNKFPEPHAMFRNLRSVNNSSAFSSFSKHIAWNDTPCLSRNWASSLSGILFHSMCSCFSLFFLKTKYYCYNFLAANLVLELHQVFNLRCMKGASVSFQLPYSCNAQYTDHHRFGINRTLLTSDGRKLVTAGRDGCIKTWDVAEKDALLLNSFEEHVDWVNDLILFRDKTLISASSDNTIMMWDIEDNKHLLTFRYDNLDSNAKNIERIQIT
jgi:WD40 repeat protein